MSALDDTTDSSVRAGDREELQARVKEVRFRNILGSHGRVGNGGLRRKCTMVNAFLAHLSTLCSG